MINYPIGSPIKCYLSTNVTLCKGCGEEVLLLFANWLKRGLYWKQENHKKKKNIEDQKYTMKSTDISSALGFTSAIRML